MTAGSEWEFVEMGHDSMLGEGGMWEGERWGEFEAGGGQQWKGWSI